MNFSGRFIPGYRLFMAYKPKETQDHGQIHKKEVIRDVESLDFQISTGE
jgi:hypothetical protein